MMTDERVRRTSPRKFSWPLAVLVSSILTLCAAPLVAQPTTAAGSAYGEKVDLQLAPLLGSVGTLESGPQPQVDESGSDGFDESRQDVSATAGLPQTGNILTSGTLQASTTSQLPIFDQVRSEATIENLGINLVPLLPLVTVGAERVEAVAEITGTCGDDLVADASTRLLNGQILAGTTLPIPENPDPNTLLFDQLGIQIVLNRQAVTGNPVDGYTVSVDALVVTVEDSLLAALGTLDGEIVVGHAEASLTCGESGEPDPVADLGASLLAAPTDYEPGERLDFRFQVANDGPDDAPDVQVVAEVSDELSLVAARLDGVACALAPPFARCPPTPLAASGVASLELETDAQGSDLASVTTTVSSSVADPDPADNQVEVFVQPRTTGIEPQADLSTRLLSSPDQVPLGTIGRFVLEITNQGPERAEDVTVHCTVPARAELVAADLEEGSCTPVDGGDAVRCQLAPMAVGETRSMEIEGRAIIPGLATSTLTVSSSVDDPDPSDNSLILSARIPESDSGGTGGGDGEGDDGPTEALSTACRLGVQPAATLLVPWFEVDLSSARGETTLIAVTNTDSAPRLARVTLWTDWAVPTTSFDLYLTGFDVATLNLRDVFAGQLPGTGSAESPHGPLSGAQGAFEGCTTTDLASDLASGRVAHLRSRHLGEPSPLDSLCAASPRSGAMGQIATGYVTIDVVRRCSELTPADAGYFGDDGVASNANVLMGEVLYVGPGDNSAQGETAIHLAADPFTFRRGDTTFYGRYSNGDDARQPLPSRWATRFMTGGPFSGGTELIVWRGTGSPDAEAVGCGSEPSWGPLGDRGVLYFDEEENPGELGSSTERFPWATGKVTVGAAPLAVDPAFGWMILDFRGSPLERPVQTFVAPVMSASGRYSVSFGASQLGTGCP